MTDKDKLKQRLKSQRYWRTSEIIALSSELFSNRCERNARILRGDGFLRRLSKDETFRVWGETRELGYEVMEKVDLGVLRVDSRGILVPNVKFNGKQMEFA